MPRKENGQDSRQRILDAALDVFYEVGFDGARMDAIAKRAGVNQALIYYYFNSKEGLFKELLNININEMISVKKDAIGRKDIYNMEVYNADVVRKVVDRVMGVLREKEKIFSIVLGELFRNPSRKSGIKIFETFLPAVKESKEWLSAMGFDPKNIDRVIIAGFFFGSVPMITYSTLGEKVAEDYGLGQEELRQIFTEMIYRFSNEYVGFLKDKAKTGAKKE